jgi:TM2 domain-containing membrane protein YozV
MHPVPNQTRDAREIEQRLLELAHTTDAKITVPALAYFASCSFDDAARVLDDLAVRDRLTMEVEDDGTIVYQLRGRQRLPALRRHPVELAPFARPPRDASPAIAAVLSALFPGAGHLYAGRIAAAVLWFLAVSVGYALFFPGLFLHVVSIFSAARAARRIGAARAPLRLAAAPGGW